MNKKIGNAVCRNYIKRVMRELFRNSDRSLDIPYCDFWVSIKKKFGRKDFKRIESLLIKSLVKNESE